MFQSNKNQKNKIDQKRKIKANNTNNVYFTIALIVMTSAVIFIYQVSKKIAENESKIQEINLCLYKEATFSDSFFSDAWIDMEKTTLIYNKKAKNFSLPRKNQILSGSLRQETNEENFKNKIVVSKKINFEVKEIKGAQITKSDFIQNNSEINYYFSNNNGLNWQKTQIGKKTPFKSIGNSLIWKVEIIPNQNSENQNENNTTIDSMFLKYWYER